MHVHVVSSCVFSLRNVFQDPFVCVHPEVGIRKNNLLEGKVVVDPVYEYATRLARAIEACGKNRIACGLSQVCISFSFFFVSYSHAHSLPFFFIVWPFFLFAWFFLRQMSVSVVSAG